jgi:hypothetical protein
MVWLVGDRYQVLLKEYLEEGEGVRLLGYCQCLWRIIIQWTNSFLEVKRRSEGWWEKCQEVIKMLLEGGSMAKVHPITEDKSGALLGYRIECPACKSSHVFWIVREDRPRWSFNGDPESPTFSPSMLVRGQQYPSGTPWPTEEEVVQIRNGEKLEMKPSVCHSFVEDGKIRFLNDCTHAMAGQTVDLPNI